MCIKVLYNIKNNEKKSGGRGAEGRQNLLSEANRKTTKFQNILIT